MKRLSYRSWNVKKDEAYLPFVTILVPAYNEEKVIRFKMENLMKLDYPRDKLQIMIVNDGSTDGTLQEISEFQKLMTDIKIEVLDNPERRGKTDSMNLALRKAKGEVVVVSDADCFWQPNIFHKALPFLSDPSIGAVTGLEILLNPAESWVTKTEVFYNDMVHTIRVGESKFYSTIFFQGGFGAYKRFILDQFDAQADDSGTALNIVQKGYRTLLLPEASYFTCFTGVWKGKVTAKRRRAEQLIRIWFRCLRLLVSGKLRLPKRIFLPEAYLYLISPFIFLLLIPTSILVILENPIFLLPFSSFLVATIFIKKLRTLIVEAVQDQLILLGAIFSSIFKHKFFLWNTAASRVYLTREMLESKGLI